MEGEIYNSGQGKSHIQGKENIYTGEITDHEINGEKWTFITKHPCQASDQHPVDYLKSKEMFRQYMNHPDRAIAREIYSSFFIIF